MRDLVGGQIVGHGGRSHDHAPAVADRAVVRAAGAPAAPGVGDRDLHRPLAQGAQMMLGPLDQHLPRQTFDEVLDPTREGLALAAGLDDRAVGRIDQARRARAAGRDQPGVPAEQGNRRAGFERRSLRPLGQPLAHPAGLGAGEGDGLGEAAFGRGDQHGLSRAAVDADRQPPGARIDRQPGRDADGVRRQPLAVPVLHRAPRCWR